MRDTSPSRFPTHPAKRITALLSVHDHAHHASLVSTLIQKAREMNLAGATVFRGEQGYGASGEIHRQHIFTDDAPLAFVLVDRPERIDAYLREVEHVLHDVLVTVDEIDVVEL